MQIRPLLNKTLVFVVLTILTVVVAGCVSENSSSVLDASDDIRASASGTGEATPTPITTGHPVESNLVSPISATFFPERQATEYVVNVNTPDDGGEWSTPSCGESRVDSDGHRMTWFHAHPPCDPTTNHDAEEVPYEVEIATFQGSEDARCTYQGSATGIGELCVWYFNSDSMGR